ncbi:hypothetical protein [Mesorhizobium amorphae]
MIQIKQGRLSAGQVIQFVRQKLFVDELGRHLNQADLYRRCQGIEDADHGDVSKKRRFGEVNDDSYASKKMRRLETPNNIKVTTYELAVVARAFDLPPNFFLSEYASHDAVREAFDTVTAQPVELDGFPRIYETDPVPQSRQKLAQTIARRIGPRRTGLAVTVIEGPTSVGKSFFVGYLYSKVLKENFSALRYLNCSKLTIDQIVPQLKQLSFDFRESVKGAILPKPAKHDLVVLDGLRLDQFREGPKMPGAAVGRRPSISDLMAIIAQIQRRSNPTDIIILLESNGDAIRDHRFAEPLAPGVQFHRDFIDPLNREEGVDFLRESGAATLSSKLAAQIVEYFYGMPMALLTVAEEIRNLGAIQTERYVDDLRKGSEFEENALTRSGKFIAKYLQRLEENVGSDQADNPTFVHPHAFLRLLSLMPGPISRAHLTDIVRELAIKRIGRFSDLQATVRSLPFVVETDDSYDLHGMVRGFLVAEIDQRVKNGTFDEFIVREELERIHWRCALLNWRMIKNATKADEITVEAIDSFVHHITKLIALLPDSRRQRKQKPISDDVIRSFEARHDSLTDYPLWSIAYEKAAKPFLLDSTFQATRLHGQYHAKARILERLIQAVEDGIPLPDIPFAELYKEASLCWLHTGRLYSAEEFYYRGVHVLRRIEPNFALFLNGIRPGVEGQVGERWRLLCDAVSIEAIIKTRQGRQNDDIRGILEPYAVAAARIADDARHRENDGKQFSPALESGAIRIISRLAELEFNAGNLDVALGHFAKANDLQQLVKGRILDGEAARKYAAALLRLNMREQIDQVFCLVTDNLNRMKQFESSRGRVSNDIVPFLALEVAVYRHIGEFDVAQQLFAKLASHRYVQEAECTFMATLEVELERFRLAIATGKIEPTTESQIRKHVDECDRSHHLLLANEFRLLQAEVCPQDSKEGLVLESRRKLQTSGHRLRIIDCDLLESGQSAVKLIGI